MDSAAISAECPSALTVRAASTCQSHSLAGLQSSFRPVHGGETTAAHLGLRGVSLGGGGDPGDVGNGSARIWAPLNVVQLFWLGLIKPPVPEGGQEPWTHQVCSHLKDTGAEINTATQWANSAPAIPAMLPRPPKKRERDRSIISDQPPLKVFHFCNTFLLFFVLFSSDLIKGGTL